MFPNCLPPLTVVARNCSSPAHMEYKEAMWNRKTTPKTTPTVNKVICHMRDNLLVMSSHVF